MDVVSLLIAIIVIVAVASIAVWFLRQVDLPQPVHVAVYAILAIVAILVVVRFAGVRF